MSDWPVINVLLDLNILSPWMVFGGDKSCEDRAYVSQQVLCGHGG